MISVIYKDGKFERVGKEGRMVDWVMMGRVMKEVEEEGKDVSGGLKIPLDRSDTQHTGGVSRHFSFVYMGRTDKAKSGMDGVW